MDHSSASVFFPFELPQVGCFPSSSTPDHNRLMTHPSHTMTNNDCAATALCFLTMVAKPRNAVLSIVSKINCSGVFQRLRQCFLKNESPAEHAKET